MPCVMGCSRVPDPPARMMPRMGDKSCPSAHGPRSSHAARAPRRGVRPRRAAATGCGGRRGDRSASAVRGRPRRLTSARRAAWAIQATTSAVATAPTARAARGADRLGRSSPTIGLPIGVEPRNTTLSSASTRPRMAGAARSCTTAFAPEMISTLVKPDRQGGDEGERAGWGRGQRGRRHGQPQRRPGRGTSGRGRSCGRRASAPTTEPRLIVANSSVNVVAVPPNVRSASSGSVTW